MGLIISGETLDFESFMSSPTVSPRFLSSLEVAIFLRHESLFSFFGNQDILGPMEKLVLKTKLYIPLTRSDLVSRPRLIERLNEGLRRKLTLISAPAGSGKTTLVSDWLHQSKMPAAWLSLDEGDNDSTHFLAYLVGALQTIIPSIGEGVLAVLQSPQPPPIEATLTTLLNEITTIPDTFALVLDDYHVIEAQSIDQALTFLLNHLPPQMHLVITTREDPQLPLARLRVRGQLTELRVTDLRFSLAEAAEFLNQVMGLTLSAEEIAALEARTEGWIAGLQMAALSLQGRADTATFIQAFTGSHRFVLDYLVEEVLQSQTERGRSFLLQTSILDRLTGPLCDAVTGQEEGNVMLAALERGNLFVVPLDDQRQWYRYHHLFADVLQARLMEEQPNQGSDLHLRASQWYEQHDLPSHAIHHAFAAEDFERAASLVELAWPAIFRGFQPATWLGWVKALPDELVRARPVLSVGYAWTLLDGGELQAAEARLRDAERWLDAAADMNERPETPSAQSCPESFDDAQDKLRRRMVVVNEKEFRSLPASIASARAYLAQALGDVPATVTNARRALDLLPEEDHYQRGITAMFLGLAYWTNGELEAAYRSLVDSVASLHMAGNIYFQIVGTVFLADIRLVQGRLHEAASTYERSLQLVTEQGEPAPAVQGTADLYVGLSELERERGDLESATQHLLTGKKLSEQAVLPGSAYRLCVAMARIKEALGDFDHALELLHEAERLYKRDPVPDMRPVAALKARVWIRQGKLAEALDWASERALSVDNDLSYLREFEYITLARILIAQYKSDGIDRSIHEVIGLLERLLQAAEAGGRTGSVTELLVLQALAHQAQGDIPPALLSLKRALTLAEPEGYVRIFVDEGQPMQTLLAESLAHGADPVYVTRLLAAIKQQMGDDTATPDPNQLLIEPLSKRELEVLRLLAIGHTNQAVADELIIAVSTVKKHVNNIFGKLGVSSRTQAVSRARELALL
jgi:LuxR family maltose regulon positive regulatory protein